MTRPCTICGHPVAGVTLYGANIYGVRICYACIWTWVRGAMTSLWIWDATA